MMDLAKIQTAEQLEIDRQLGILEELGLSGQRLGLVRTVYVELQNAIITIPVVLILIVGGGAVAMRSMTLGELLSFYVAVGLLSNYVRLILGAIPQVIIGNESLTNLSNLMHTEDTPPYFGQQQIVLGGKITLDSVYFQYKEQPVLRDVSIRIHPGTTVAVVGPNGAGKSTIANLVLGFYRPQEGQLYADDHPFNDLDIVHLRRRIGVVPQEPILFPGTIWENITYGSPDVSFGQVIEAARLATAHRFIEQSPQGYDTFVGEDGMLLSGGQRQRLALARALLRRPALLILDEPTNHLDEAAVQQLMDNLQELDNVPAILIISHDMDVVRQAQQIYILNEGRIVGSGDYAALTSGETAPRGTIRPMQAGESVHASNDAHVAELQGFSRVDPIHGNRVSGKRDGLEPEDWTEWP
jgi:ABC-type bacteriocin/lantibiotic exporter with double-glycine peptidase domain